MHRRDFVKVLGAAAAWPVTATAQQTGMPVVGFLSATSPEPFANLLMEFRKALGEYGFAEGRNVRIEYRWAYNDVARLPELAADLVRRRVSVITTIGGNAAPLAAKAVTTTIPIVFSSGGDPVQAGLVASLNRPGGNITGFSAMAGEIAGKRVGLLRELVPPATRFAVLINPTTTAESQIAIADVRKAVAVLGLELEVLAAATNRDIDGAFASLVEKHADALVISPDPFFVNRRVQLITLATHHKVPAIYYDREFVEGGGLMGYGSSRLDQARQAGTFTGRVLKGEKPADMPVIRATKFEFVINLQTARTLGIEVPPTLLAIADEVIE